MKLMELRGFSIRDTFEVCDSRLIRESQSSLSETVLHGQCETVLHVSRTMGLQHFLVAMMVSDDIFLRSTTTFDRWV